MLWRVLTITSFVYHTVDCDLIVVNLVSVFKYWNWGSSKCTNEIHNSLHNTMPSRADKMLDVFEKECENRVN